MSTAALASTAVQMLDASFSQQIGTAVARQQIAAQNAVAGLVAQSAEAAAPPAPAGQGRIVDIRA